MGSGGERGVGRSGSEDLGDLVVETMVEMVVDRDEGHEFVHSVVMEEGKGGRSCGTD